MQNISLFIPRVFSNYTAEMITAVFNKLNIGKIKQIDLVSKMALDGKTFNTVYVHFDYWYDTVVARNFYSLVVDPTKEARITYDAPWFWVVLENKGKKFVSGDRKPKIVLDAPSISVTSVSTKIHEQVLQEEVKIAKCELSFNTQETQTQPEPDVEEVNPEEEISAEDIEQMEEIDAYIEEEEQHLITIDGRYVDTLEQENNALRCELEYLRQAFYLADKSYQEERIKSAALAEAISLINKQ